MEVSEKPMEPNEDASTSKDQQESALISCQVFPHAGGKATGPPLSQRYMKGERIRARYPFVFLPMGLLSFPGLA